MANRKCYNKKQYLTPNHLALYCCLLNFFFFFFFFLEKIQLQKKKQKVIPRRSNLPCIIFATSETVIGKRTASIAIPRNPAGNQKSRLDHSKSSIASTDTLPKSFEVNIFLSEVFLDIFPIWKHKNPVLYFQNSSSTTLITNLTCQNTSNNHAIGICS